ncbi:MAG: amino acid-binding protein, partial [Eubacteriales bacterium]
MLIKQISIFTQNIKGDLAMITRALGDAGIDLISLSIADTSTFGVVRGIVEDSDRALKVLKGTGFTAKTTEVIAVEVPDKPGGLADVLVYLNEAGLFVEYLYSFVR